MNAFLRKVCLAAIEVCVFYASTAVGAFFNIKKARNNLAKGEREVMKKSIVSIFCALTILANGVFAGFSAVSAADDTQAATGDTQTTSAWTYETVTYGGASGIAVTGYSGTATDIFIPAQIDGKNVLKLGDGLFQGKTGINSVSLDEGIKVIGKNAFAGATNLLCIVTPKTLVEIGENAFSGCSAFNSVVLYSAVTTIGENAFEDCPNVKIYGAAGSAAETYAAAGNLSFTVISENATPETATQNGVTYYIKNGEASANAIDSTAPATLIIPSTIEGYPVTDIGAVFNNYKGRARTVIIGGNVKSIKDEAFRGSYVQEVFIPDSVKSIGELAFYHCDYLRSVSLPKGITAINRNTFGYCGDLQTINIPDSVTILGEEAFGKCESLTSISGGKNVRSIGRIAFRGCEKLTDMSVFSSVTNIGDQAFNGCKNLEKIIVPNGVTRLETDTFGGCSKATSVSLPSGLRTIDDAAFSGCAGLTSVTLDGVQTIDESAFSGCKGLTSVTLGSNVTTIGKNAFSGCTSLKSIVIPQNVRSMQADSFPSGTVLCVSENSYAHTFAKNNNLLYFIPQNGSEPEFVTQDGISYYIANENAVVTSVEATVTSVTLPDTVNDYPVTRFGDAFQGNTTLREITIGSNVTRIENSAFMGCTNLQNVTLGSNVTRIEDSAFSGCTNLRSVALGSNVRSIGNNAFRACTALPGITIDGVESIGQYAFAFCSALTSITIPSSVKSIGYAAFQRCYNLETAIISEGVTAVSGSMFEYCEKLKNVTLPSTLETIGQCAFTSCTALTEMTVPSKVTAIPSYFVSGCTNLTSVTIPGSVTSIDYKSFADCPKLQTLLLPQSITTILSNQYATPFSAETVLCVYQDSAAHTFAVENNLLYYVTQNGEMPEFVTQDGITYYIANGKATVLSVGETVKTANIPDKIGNAPVTDIGTVFKKNTSITSVRIPSGVKTIDGYAFQECYRLKSVSIANGVESIGQYAFYNCCDLTSVTIPDSVTSLGIQAFRSCTSLQSVTIGNGVPAIGRFTFEYCCKLTDINIGSGVQSIGENAFARCEALKKVNLPDSVTSIDKSAFFMCEKLTDVTLGGGIKTIAASAFGNCSKIATVVVPNTVTSLSADSFTSNTILCVYENSYAHRFAESNSLSYFIIHQIENPDIAYGMGIAGKATYSDGTAVKKATVNIYYDDGTLKESVKTDNSGNYAFTYAEVGAYTIAAVDAAGQTGRTQVSVKRMNAFDVFVVGEKNITVKNAYKVSGKSTPGASVTLSDTDGRVIGATTADADGAFAFTNVTNGTYIIKAENETGSCTKEVTVYLADLDIGTLEISPTAQYASIKGKVSVMGREPEQYYKRAWVSVTLYNAEGMVVGQTKTDENGDYAFTKLALDEYAIVAQTEEMRHDPHRGFDRSYELTGYAYVNAEEAKEYTAEDIILYEENDNLATISGIVRAGDVTTASSVTLKNVFRHEIARCTTDSSGKYAFTNVRDGLYFVFAVTEKNGMGFTVVTVHRGRVFGRTDIWVFKHEKIKEWEGKMNQIPHCAGRDDAIKYREDIRKQKMFYDGLSEKEKMEFSPDYVERLNKLCEWVTDVDCKGNGGSLSYGGMIASQEELGKDNAKIELVLTVTKTQPHTVSQDGIKNQKDFEQQNIENAMGDRKPVQYYDISLTKNGTPITDISRQTDSTGKLRVTLEIPPEYRGHKNYSFVHMHNGVATTLVDLDDDPNTVTFEIDRFSTFALAYTDEELSAVSAATITYSAESKKITVKSTEAATLYIATYNGNTLSALQTHAIAADTDGIFDFNTSQTAFLWKTDMSPLCGKFNITPQDE